MGFFRFLLNEKNRYNDFSLDWNCKGEETIFKANDNIYFYFHRGGRDDFGSIYINLRLSTTYSMLGIG